MSKQPKYFCFTCGITKPAKKMLTSTLCSYCALHVPKDDRDKYMHPLDWDVEK